MVGLTTGLVVHCVAPNGKHLAAIVTKLWNASGIVNLNVAVPGDTENGSYDSPPWERKTSVAYSADAEPGTWPWIGIEIEIEVIESTLAIPEIPYPTQSKNC